MNAPATDDLIHQGLAHHRAGDLAHAEKLYRAVLEKNPADLNALQLLAALTPTTGRTQQAIVLFERAVATLTAQGGAAPPSTPRCSTTSAMRCVTPAAAPMRSWPIGAASRSIRVVPEFACQSRATSSTRRRTSPAPPPASSRPWRSIPPTANSRSASPIAHAAAGRHDDAADHTLAGAAARPRPATSMHSRRSPGRALTSAGRLDEAIVSFRAAVATDPALCPARLNLAAALVLAKQMEPAVEYPHGAQCVVERPDDPAVQWDLAVALHGLNRPGAGARRDRAASSRSRPRDANAFLLAGMIHHEAGNLNEAMTSCAAALRVKPDMNEALLRLAVVLADLGRHAEAIEASRQQPQGRAGQCAGAVRPRRLAHAHRRWTARPRSTPTATRLRAFQARLSAGALSARRAAQGHGPARARRDRAALSARARARPCRRPHRARQRAAGARPRRGIVAGAMARRPRRAAPAQQAADHHRAEPAFSVLVIMAPGAGNTPYRYLIGKNSYECNLYALLPNVEPDLALLRQHGDIVLNLISDADQGRDMLAGAAALVDQPRQAGHQPSEPHPRHQPRRHRTGAAGDPGLPRAAHASRRARRGRGARQGLRLSAAAAHTRHAWRRRLREDRYGAADRCLPGPASGRGLLPHRNSSTTARRMGSIASIG